MADANDGCRRENADGKVRMEKCGWKKITEKNYDKKYIMKIIIEKSYKKNYLKKNKKYKLYSGQSGKTNNNNLSHIKDYLMQNNERHPLATKKWHFWFKIFLFAVLPRGCLLIQDLNYAEHSKGN